MGGNPNAVKGGTGKAEAAKLQDAGISPKQWPKKMCGRKRLAYPTRRKSVRRADHVNMRDEKKGRECTRAGVARWKELHRSEGGTVSYRWDWAIRGEDPENGQRGSKSVTAAPWKWPIMAWSTVCDDYFRWPTNQELAPRWQGLHLCKL